MKLYTIMLWTGLIDCHNNNSTSLHKHDWVACMVGCVHAWCCGVGYTHVICTYDHYMVASMAWWRRYLSICHIATTMVAIYYLQFFTIREQCWFKGGKQLHYLVICLLHFFFFSVGQPYPPPTLEIHHQLQAVEALHVPLRLRDRWCFPSLLGVRPSP
jgi:hypothetical protein